ncbi:ABC transporter substrate-binding protein [Agrobacterium rhizogenes]|uniref:Oligopeptide ABC transporter n=1 Tax=Rhizobium rhizogenes (strain K84 / ATCC BAA-868) TaxID=311403 RepID=B9JNL3_RHIR8|nr:ABC transporter substrate-binding protein [Rhizobium rhizogenes]ACM29144.1 oligopeptide ABC transporter [Rhizobium rhizogenes K84]OCJ20863.1 ABC transporter substrate-binding protein [Agrobacterium sp. B133/95]NTH14664.1 ABC transporter substrate-binding protein [Rhizobium rhizogenes]NTH21008.1 ABC transporter substrate-binding protein [Rhizobium rhizogenes]NTH34017.1 ABC transporter substrate-binding protein [Rhizobium rhizogenes]
MNIRRRQFNQVLAFATIGTVAPLGRFARAAEPAAGGTLTLLVQPEPPTLVTLAHTAGPTTRVSGKVTEGLLAYGLEDFKPIPQLATEWQVSDDGLQYTFKLRQGVKWHDGKDFTSADVAFSILALKEVHPRGRATFSSVTEVATPDDHTAIIKLSKPAPYLLGALQASESPIVPKHVYEGSTDLPGNANGRAPVGTGPFIFREWVVGSHVILDRNPDYWDKGLPYLDRIVIKFIPDASARLAALETGEVDIAPDTPVSLSEIDRIKTLPTLSVEDRGNDYSPTVYRIEFNLANKYFQHDKVRQAIAHAIDRQKIADIAFYGYAIPAPSPISPYLKTFYNPDVPIYAFDQAKAETLLDEAGFPRGADGIRFEVPHDVMPYGDTYSRIGDYLRDTLSKIGIKVDLRGQDVPTWLKRVYTDRDFAFVTGGMGNTFDPTIGVQRLYWSKNFKKGVPFSNGSGYNNPEIDSIFEQAAVENDHAKRVELFNRMQVIIATDLPDITLVSFRQLTILNKKVQDHTVVADGLSGSLSNAYLLKNA